MDKKKKILNRAEDIIIKYHDDDSIYYQELLKSYNEYANLNNLDKTTEELYIKHIDGLCEMVVEKKNSKHIILSLVVVLLIMLGLSTYSTFNYIKMSKDINGILYKNKATLSVNYGNLENFNALTLSDINEYQNLHPLTLSLSTDSINKSMNYNIYLVENNDGLEEDEILDRDVFLYNVKSSNRDSGIKYIKNATEKNRRILIYSSSVEPNVVDNIEIRMWIDKDAKDYENKLYRFKLYVEGY